MRQCPAAGRANHARAGMGLASVLLAAALIAQVSAQAPQTHPLTGRRIAGVSGGADWLDRSEREQEEQPDRALELVGIKRGMTVADVGAGSGYVTMKIARRVGPTGKVYATDLQPTMLALIAGKIEKQKLTNVELIQGALNDTRLPEAAIDLAILIDVYHEFSRPQEMLRSLRRSLKPDGRLVLLEYRKEDRDLPIYEEHKMSIPEVRKELEAEGFALDRIIRALPQQHIFVFKLGT